MLEAEFKAHSIERFAGDCDMEENLMELKPQQQAFGSHRAR